MDYTIAAPIVTLMVTAAEGTVLSAVTTTGSNLLGLSFKDISKHTDLLGYSSKLQTDYITTIPPQQ